MYRSRTAEKARKQCDVIDKTAKIDTFFKKPNIKIKNVELNPDILLKELDPAVIRSDKMKIKMQL